MDEAQRARIHLMIANSKFVGDDLKAALAEIDRLKKKDEGKPRYKIVDEDKLRKILIDHEALRLKVYKCSAGKNTIGIGRELDNHGISEKEAHYLLENDIAEVIKDLSFIFSHKDLGFESFSENRKLALCDMRFQLGYGTFRKFGKMIQAIFDLDWSKAADEAKDSRY